MEGNEIVWELIKDNFEQARSHEDYREKTVTLTLTLAGILIAALAIDGFAAKKVTIASVPMTFQQLDGACLIAIGIFGALCSQKHYERNRMHIAMAQHFLAKLTEVKPDLLPFDVATAFASFLKSKKWKASWAEPIKLNWLWTGFPLILIVVGVILLIGT